MAAPPTAHLWIMENGEQYEHLALSPVAGSANSSSLIRFSLEAIEEDLDKIHGPDFKPGGVNGPSHSEVQGLAPLWGIAFGVPDVWLPSQCGALIITRILDDGALARWNMWQHRDFGSSAENVLPNALIWRVNDMEGDVPRMADELCAAGGRRSITLTVLNPASSRFPHTRRPRSSGVRLPPMPPAARAFMGRGPMQPPRPPEAARSPLDPNQEVLDLRNLGRTQMPSTLGLLNLPPPPPLLPPRPPGREGSPSPSEAGHSEVLPPLPKAAAFSYRRAANIQRNNGPAQSLQREANDHDLRGIARTGMSSPRPPGELPG